MYEHAFSVRGRLAERDRLLRLDSRRRDPLHPLVGAVGVSRLRRQHPRVGPAGRALSRDQVLHRRLRGLQRVRLVRPRRARSTASPFLNRSISSDASAQYFLISGRCCLEQVDSRVQLILLQRIRVLDAELRSRSRQVERGVGDLDRVVGDGDLALVSSGRRASTSCPAWSSRLSCCRAACSGPTAARRRSACRRPCCAAATSAAG